jgi:LysW-gamma-L-lysine carboxypeptidase
MDEVTLLWEMLEIPSPSGQETELVAYLIDRMGCLGFDVSRDAAGNVIGAMGDGPRELMLLGHVDTVAGWIPVRLEDGRLYGRGAVDAKGPLAAFILAAARVGPIPGLRVWVVGAVEEETTSRGARALLGRFAPDAVVIGEPSGWNHITIGYKGSFPVTYRLRAPCRHSATYVPSVAERAVAFWDAVADYARRYNRGEQHRFHTLDPSLRRIVTRSDGLEEEVEMHLTLRLPPGLDPAALRAQMESWADGASLQLGPIDPPYQADKNSPLARLFLRAIRARGGAPSFKLKTGTSDMNVVGPVWQCPIVAYGPGDSALDHTPDEHLDLEEFRKSIRVLEEVIRGMSPYSLLHTP